MKKNISLFLALAICIMQLVIPTTVYAAENPSVTATNASGAPEDEIQIDFILSDNPGLTALLVKVEYDSNFLELIDIKDYGFFGRVFTKPTITNNPINLNWVDGIDNYSENGKLATMIFKIKESAAEGQTSLTLTTRAGETYNYDKDNDDYTDYDLNLSGGTITVKKSANTDTVVKPAIQNATPDGFVIKAQAGYEYCISESNSIPDGDVWTTNTIVTGKTPNTTYYVFGRIAATNTTEASAPSASTLVKIPNDDATLKSLNVAAGTISPAFVPTTYDYTVTLPYGGSISDVVVVSNDTNASYEFTKTATDFGANNITEITVTAENGVDTKVYTVTYSEINAALSALTINGALVTGFNPDTTSYTYAVPYAAWKADTAKTYAIVATTSKDTSTVVISDNNFALISTDSDENADKNVTVTVTAEGGENTTYTIKFTVLACPHSNATVTPGTAADCTNDGSEIYECPDCGKSDTRVITALGHDWSAEWTEDTPATCTTDGSKSHHCSRCDAKNDITVINALGHAWNRWANVEGTENYERTCSRCNTTETKTAADISHEHVFNGETEIITPPTCTTEGLQKVWCSVESCPEFVEESVNKAPHTPGTPKVVNATCSAEGLSTTKCTVCGETLSTSVLPKTDHSYGTAWEKNKNGHWNTCSVCGESSNVEAHVENDGVITTPATNTEDGVKAYSCMLCGFEMRTEVIPATGTNVEPPIPPYNPPYIPSENNSDASSSTVVDISKPQIKGDNGKSGWEAISDEIAKTPDGGTVTVSMNRTTELPKSILEDIKGKNINLVLEMDGEIIWTVNGQGVTNPKTVNMKVSTNTKRIPADVIDNINGGKTTIQISITHNGDFGFIPMLTINLGKKYDSRYANLFYYNKSKKEMAFMDTSVIIDGNAIFAFAHASEYAIVIDDISYREDVSSAASISEKDNIISSGNAAVYLISLVIFIGIGYMAVVIVKKRVNKF